MGTLERVNGDILKFICVYFNLSIKIAQFDHNVLSLYLQFIFTFILIALQVYIYDAKHDDVILYNFTNTLIKYIVLLNKENLLYAIIPRI